MDQPVERDESSECRSWHWSEWGVDRALQCARAVDGFEEVVHRDLERHTWATIALRAGIHPRVVQERLGHSNIAITLQTYSHVLPTMHDDAAMAVASLFMPGGSITLRAPQTSVPTHLGASS